MTDILKIATYIPREYTNALMDRITEVIVPVYEGYDRTFSLTDVTGTWRPLDGSDPFIGTHGEIEISPEVKVEFVIRKNDLKVTIDTIVDVHPYEEPAIDVIEMIDWHSVR